MNHFVTHRLLNTILWWLIQVLTSCLVMQAIHAFDPRLLAVVNDPSWRCLSGVRVNRQIMQLLPNIKVKH